MRLLVTGGLGFIGSNFILHVHEMHPDFRITNVDAGLLGANKKNLASLQGSNRYKYIKGNIIDKKLIDKLVSGTDVIINFAAESHVDRSIKDPRPFVDSNIVGVCTILEAVRRYKKKFIQISTDEVFGSLKKVSASEKYLLNPSSPYAASKASAELLVQSYITTYGCDAIITRCTNNYGPRQSPEKLIPKTIILAEKNRLIPIYGTGKNIRDWIYVLDHCDAILKILFKGKSGISYNISATNEIDNLTIVRKILKIMGKSLDLIHFTKDRPGHDFRYSLNSRKIRSELHWKPKHNFEKGLERTISWYIENKKWWRGTPYSILSAPNWKTR
jgi:dTDP-glucose 4,6-dehydratase